MTTSDAVGFTKVKLSSLMLNNGTDDNYQIVFDNKPAGTVNIVSLFEPVGGDQYENMKAEYQEQEAALIAEAEAAKEALANL